MTWMRCVGGHANGKWYDVDIRAGSITIPEIRSISFREHMSTSPTSLAESPVFTTYAIERLIWPGFRFPIYVLSALGVKISGQGQPYDSSWPNPLVPVRCRCEEIDADKPWAYYNLSACHLDHCSVHGRWTFPPITPMHVSMIARAEWLAAKERGMRTIAPAEYIPLTRKRGLELPPERRHTQSTDTEPATNRPYTA